MRVGTTGQNRPCTVLIDIFTRTRSSRRDSIVIIPSMKLSTDASSCSSHVTTVDDQGISLQTKKSTSANHATTKRSINSTRSRLGPAVSPTKSVTRTTKWISSTRPRRSRKYLHRSNTSSRKASRKRQTICRSLFGVYPMHHRRLALFIAVHVIRKSHLRLNQHLVRLQLPH